MSDQPMTQVVTGESTASDRQQPPPLPADNGTGRPKRHMVPIEQPSAFGRDPGRFFSLLWLTAVQDFRLMYRTSILGYVWTLMRPLAFFAVLYLVFTHVIRFGDTVPNYSVLLLMNLMLYQFFSDATAAAMTSVVYGEQVVRKMHFPRVVIPLAKVLTAAMTSGLNLVVVVGFMLFSGIYPSLTWLLLPVIAIGLVLFSAAVSVLLSITYVWMRDLQHIWGVVLRVLLYAVPIIYPLERVPESFQWVVTLNPLTVIIYQARVWLVQPDAPSIVTVAGLAPVVGSFAIGAALCVGAIWVFARKAPRVAEAI